MTVTTFNIKISDEEIIRDLRYLGLKAEYFIAEDKLLVKNENNREWLCARAVYGKLLEAIVRNDGIRDINKLDLLNILNDRS